MNSGIYILSLPIQSGKTTLLQQWLKAQTVSVAGFLSPDINGRRHLLNISTNELRCFQLADDADGIKIGRFVFDSAVFEWGKEMLQRSLQATNDWIMIDEVGRLEINENSSWEPILTEVIKNFQSRQHNRKLLLVIRDYLLDEAIEKYGLQSAKVLPASFFADEKLPALNGLVLCGGESNRMKQPKALLQYHNDPQFLHVAKQLALFCNSVYISANMQLDNTNGFTVIPDADQYKHAGPISGVLSAIEKNAVTALFTLGCDYPYLQRKDLLQLFNALDDEHEAFCFQHPKSKFVEPLIAVYHPSCFAKMKQYFDGGGQSLQKFLVQINTKVIIPKDDSVLKSHDTPEDFLTFKKE